MVDNNRVQQDPTALIGPACIAGRRSNGVEAQRLRLDKGLDAGVGGGNRDVKLQAGPAAQPAQEVWKTQQT